MDRSLDTIARALGYEASPLPPSLTEQRATRDSRAQGDHVRKHRPNVKGKAKRRTSGAR